ncbi:hypothetical protein [Tepidibacter formicigenes]|jgi:hypothetical protein|uniref:Uncharacterized protein n=1 Tax=Tepidibacter formicigenes DSM 15518 TaxID=1123349 RepID=A0A1M6RF97_9FIRM|nr:hypothetical protein [Tepidibacter formicigenes]SHK31080.1 hypothetical protein SAMN02744037_02094 [Tepidibacter formicigenes DSM 15518]
MLEKLSENQLVKMTKGEDGTVEYGLVMGKNNEKEEYEVLSIGFINKNGEFLCYPTEVENIKENLKINDRIFEEVKERKIRRKINKWLEENYDKFKN